jgi:hypothetical protein
MRYQWLVAVILVSAGCASTSSVSDRPGGMKASTEVRDTVLRFYQRMRASEMSGFEEFISKDPALVMLGSAGERIAERNRLRGVFRLKNQGLEAGPNPIAYVNGNVGWFVDQPDWVFPDGSRVHMRFTAILQKELGSWKFVHWHLSVPVPDEEAIALQQRLSKR